MRPTETLYEESDWKIDKVVNYAGLTLPRIHHRCPENPTAGDMTIPISFPDPKNRYDWIRCMGDIRSFYCHCEVTVPDNVKAIYDLVCL